MCPTAGYYAARFMIWLNAYARLVCAATVLLITAGGMVTSTGSGLAVPDWPNTYGHFMFAFPLSKMVGGIFYEHGHRMIASIVGLLTIGLTVWLWCADQRVWIRRLGIAALVAVILQGLLGGLTVLYFLPTPISVSHAGLAQIFFCLTISLSLFTSADWHRRSNLDAHDSIIRDSFLQMLATGLPALVFTQILIGATVRHVGAGLAIPDFPLSFGRVVPLEWTFAIAVHFLHRVGGAITVLAVMAIVVRLHLYHPRRSDLIHPSSLLLLLVLTQFGLGVWTVLSGRAPIINTAHVATGALVLGAALVIGLRVNRHRFPDAKRIDSLPPTATGIATKPAVPGTPL